MSARPARPSSSRRSRDLAECRCLCGSLIARCVAGGVELKCRRCKRKIVLPLESPLLDSPARASAERRP